MKGTHIHDSTKTVEKQLRELVPKYGEEFASLNANPLFIELLNGNDLLDDVSEKKHFRNF